MYKIKSALIDTFSTFGIVEYTILGGIFVIFLIFFVLALLIRRGIFAKFFYTLAFVSIFCAPLSLEYIMTKILYKIQVDIDTAQALEYTNSFFIQGSIINVGLRDIKDCVISVDILKSEKTFVDKIINFVSPIDSISQKIPAGITPQKGELNYNNILEFSVIMPNFEFKPPFTYKVNIACAGYPKINFNEKI